MLIPFKNLILNEVKGIIHIGAHEAEEIKDYLKKDIDNIIWIEANPNKYKRLEEKISNYPKMILGKFAAGSTLNELDLNIANNGQSSSLLAMGTHAESYPDIKFTSTVNVPVIPLDHWLEKNSLDSRLYNFLNIDIQGYELEALKGMPKQLENIDYIYLEVNFKKVYKNCHLINDIDLFLDKYNFKRVSTVTTPYGWGDAFYVKKIDFYQKLYYLSLSIPKNLKSYLHKFLRSLKLSILGLIS